VRVEDAGTTSEFQVSGAQVPVRSAPIVAKIRLKPLIPFKDQGQVTRKVRIGEDFEFLKKAAIENYDAFEHFLVAFPDRESFRTAQHKALSIQPSSKSSALGILSYSLTNCEVANREDVFHLFDSLRRGYGAIVAENARFAPEAEAPDPVTFVADHPSLQADGTLADVMRLIEADSVRQRIQRLNKTNAELPILAFIDSGIEGSRSEISRERRLRGWVPEGTRVPSDPWTDPEGHGTMASTIASGDSISFRGVLPLVQILPCRTDTWLAFDMADALTYLTDFAEQTSRRIVVNCSWGYAATSPPRKNGDIVLERALARAIKAGIIVCFSAGNWNEALGGTSEDCDQRNSIWRFKSREDVMVTGMSTMKERIASYSSRGPGQHFGDPGTNQKPDVVAPTPVGRIPRGADVEFGGRGWGTSGASPQAAALCCALLCVNPTLQYDKLFEIIREAAVDLNHPHNCQGRGRINCRRALAMV
jgi:serine protease AprX